MLKNKYQEKIGWWREKTRNPTFAAVAGAIAGVFFTVLAGMFTSAGHMYLVHDVITYDSISDYIQVAMVSQGLVDEKILSLSNPQEQIEMIAQILHQNGKGEKEIQNSLQQFLVSLGRDEPMVVSCSQDELLDELAVVSTEFLEQASENKQMREKLDEYKTKQMAILSEPKLHILGEEVESSWKDYMATIDGATFYSEGLLNSFLSEPIQYQDGAIYYGKDIPERVNVISAGLYYDGLALDVYDENSHFFMGNTEYSSGIVARAYISDTIRIACGENYSHIEFLLGHVDNTRTGRGKLRVSYLENGKSIEAEAVELSDGIPKT